MSRRVPFGTRARLTDRDETQTTEAQTAGKNETQTTESQTTGKNETQTTEAQVKGEEIFKELNKKQTASDDGTNT